MHPDDNLEDFRLETWYKLTVWGRSQAPGTVAGYFKDKELAEASGIGANYNGRDGVVTAILVLTKDGKTGSIVPIEEIELVDEKTLRGIMRQNALDKLTDRDKRALKLEP